MDAEMEKEMWADAPKRKIEPFGNNCRHRHLLHVDGNAASSRLASELHTGSTVFKAASASTEYFYPLLKEWEHYVPVQANLADARARHEWALAHPRRAEAIAAAGAAFAKQHLHTHGVACYWWQLLSALAELEGERCRRRLERAAEASDREQRAAATGLLLLAVAEWHDGILRHDRRRVRARNGELRTAAPKAKRHTEARAQLLRVVDGDDAGRAVSDHVTWLLSLIHISEPTRPY